MSKYTIPSSPYLTIDANNKSPLPIWTVSLVNMDETCNTEYTIKFQFQYHYKDFVAPWQTLHPESHPVWILSVDGESVHFSKAMVEMARSETFGCILDAIVLENGTTYMSPDTDQYWFPLIDKPAEFEDGTIRLFHDSETEDRLSIVVIIENHKMPFLDLSGTFHYASRIVYREVDYGRLVYCDKEERATIFSSEGKFKAYLDHTTHKLYKLEHAVEYHKIKKDECGKNAALWEEVRSEERA